MVEEKEEVEIISKSEQKRRAKEVLVFAQKLASIASEPGGQIARLLSSKSSNSQESN